MVGESRVASSRPVRGARGGGDREEDTRPGDACRARAFAGIRVRPGAAEPGAWGQEEEGSTARVDLGVASEASGRRSIFMRAKSIF